jgi:hypothetical protein
MIEIEDELMADEGYVVGAKKKKRHV